MNKILAVTLLCSLIQAQDAKKPSKAKVVKSVRGMQLVFVHGTSTPWPTVVFWKTMLIGTVKAKPIKQDGEWREGCVNMDTVYQ